MARQVWGGLLSGLGAGLVAQQKTKREEALALREQAMALAQYKRELRDKEAAATLLHERNLARDAAKAEQDIRRDDRTRDFTRYRDEAQREFSAGQKRLDREATAANAEARRRFEADQKELDRQLGREAAKKAGQTGSSGSAVGVKSRYNAAIHNAIRGNIEKSFGEMNPMGQISLEDVSPEVNEATALAFHLLDNDAQGTLSPAAAVYAAVNQVRQRKAARDQTNRMISAQEDYDDSLIDKIMSDRPPDPPAAEPSGRERAEDIFRRYGGPGFYAPRQAPSQAPTPVAGSPGQTGRPMSVSGAGTANDPYRPIDQAGLEWASQQPGVVVLWDGQRYQTPSPGG